MIKGLDNNPTHGPIYFSHSYGYLTFPVFYRQLTKLAVLLLYLYLHDSQYPSGWLVNGLLLQK